MVGFDDFVRYILVLIVGNLEFVRDVIVKRSKRKDQMRILSHEEKVKKMEKNELSTITITRLNSS